MAYKEITDMNGTNTTMTDIFTYSADVVPIFVPLVLFSIFLISVLGSYFASKRATGRGDFPASFAVGSWLTAIISIVFSLIPNFIRTGTVIFCVALAILGSIWLYISRMDKSL